MRLFIGLDLGGTAIKYGLLSQQGILLSKGQVATPRGRVAIFRALSGVVDDLKVEAKRRGDTIAAIGVGSAGIVDSVNGKIIGRSPNLPGWEGAPVKSTLERVTGLNTVVENDANVMALAEQRLGAGRGFDSGIYVTVGTGVGSGIILAGELWRGVRFAGAELGHMIIVKDGRCCPCGKRGCLERYASATALIGFYKGRLPRQSGAREIFVRARQGDAAAKAAILKAADYLATGLGSVLELLNPEVIVIGGGVAGGREYLAAVRHQLPLYCSRAALKGLKLKRARLGNDAGLIGAGLLAIDAAS